MASGSPIKPNAYRQLFRAVPGLYLVLSPDLRILDASDAYLAATLTRRHEIVGRPLFEVFPDNPGDPDATGVRNLSDSLARVLRDKVPDTMAVQRYDIRRPDDAGGGFEQRYWSPTNFPVLGSNGAIVCLIHRVEDVTEFIQMQQRSTEQEQLTAELESRTRRMESEIVNRAREIQEANRALREAKADLEARVAARTAELAEANASLLAEMAENRKLEEQFRHAQKLEAVGTLAGGIAHDFNNLLTVIAGYTEWLLEDLGADDPSRGVVTEIHEAGQRAAALTRQLLAFSRRQVMELKVLDLNGVVEGARTLIQRLVGEDVTLALKLAPELARIKADAGQLEQVIMNLAINARDAMPSGGQLTIETAEIELDDSYAAQHLEVTPGRYVMLAMSDTGHGMDAATRARIFEPFFTTKGLGKGTGLGLSTVFGIVKQSEGHLWVYSEPGQGTTFKVYLPAHADQPRPETPIAATTTPTGAETILVVEDEDAVRAVTLFALRAMGYQVLEARHGREAIQYATEHDGPIHLLISDVVMPEMGGGKVAEAVTALRPGIRVLYLSGYTDDAVVRHGILQERVAFLQKPFSPRLLGHKVREVLGGA